MNRSGFLVSFLFRFIFFLSLILTGYIVSSFFLFVFNSRISRLFPSFPFRFSFLLFLILSKFLVSFLLTTFFFSFIRLQMFLFNFPEASSQFSLSNAHAPYRLWSVSPNYKLTTILDTQQIFTYFRLLGQPHPITISDKHGWYARRSTVQVRALCDAFAVHVNPRHIQQMFPLALNDIWWHGLDFDFQLRDSERCQWIMSYRKGILRFIVSQQYYWTCSDISASAPFPPR